MRRTFIIRLSLNIANPFVSRSWSTDGTDVDVNDRQLLALRRSGIDCSCPVAAARLQLLRSIDIPCM